MPSSRFAIHLITPEFPPAIGGVGDYTRAVARGLAEAGEEVHVWCPPRGEGDSADRFNVHPEMGAFGSDDLERAGGLLDATPGPRRVIVQWVPHGYGRGAMNLPFCFWLWKRAFGGDRVELMVHEPFLAFREGNWRQTAVAVVHRFMTVILLQAAARVWVSIPAWERMWKPYALGRSIPFVWLPIPSSLGTPDPSAVGAARALFGTETKCLAGHLGTYGSLVTRLLSDVLPEILRQPNAPQMILIGTGSTEFRTAFLDQHPQYASAVRATGPLSEAELPAHVAACDVLIQPYPDGVSSRRTTAMAGLALGVPIVTTRGRLTEPLWKDSDAVRLTDVGDADAMAANVMELARHAEARTELGNAGRALYQRTFNLTRTVETLLGVGWPKAA